MKSKKIITVIIIFLLIALMTFTISGCKSSKNTETQNQTEKLSDQSTEKETEEKTSVEVSTGEEEKAEENKTSEAETTKSEADTNYTYSKPKLTDDGWDVADLDEKGVNKEMLSDLIVQIKKGKYQNIHSIVIVKEGKLVFEEYFGGYGFSLYGDKFRGTYIDFNADITHDLASVTKIITATLAGIAIDNDFIKSVNEKIIDFFPEYSKLFDKEKSKITVENLLTMTSGLKWNEMDAYSSDENDYSKLYSSADPIEYLLSKPMANKPGTKWYYSSGDVTLLGEIIYKATGKKVDDFSREYLFDPLGITNAYWLYMKNNIVSTAGGLMMRPRDMAKIGYLYLNNGKWLDKQILSEDWIKASTRGFIQVPEGEWTDWHGHESGYQWFLRTDDVNSIKVDSLVRTGWGGQRIIAYPGLNTVVVLTGGNYATYDYANDLAMLKDYIL
ncbi:MAG: beta-lactamase family protein, partial [Actinobacteria bacterium]|nr:beta-lactamase family protein [Actinomycetota bacterium]